VDFLLSRTRHELFNPLTGKFACPAFDAFLEFLLSSDFDWDTQRYAMHYFTRRLTFDPPWQEPEPADLTRHRHFYGGCYLIRLYRRLWLFLRELSAIFLNQVSEMCQRAV